MFNFKYGDTCINIVSKYKYLWVIFDEHMNFDSCETTLTESAGRALSSIISKFYTYKNIGYNVYTKLFDSYVWPILDYCSSTWSYGKYKKSEQILNRAIRYYLGVHKSVPILGIQGDMGWVLPKYRYYISMFRYWNTLTKMENSRLTRKIFEYNMQYISDNNWCDK